MSVHIEAVICSQAFVKISVHEEISYTETGDSWCQERHPVIKNLLNQTPSNPCNGYLLKILYILKNVYTKE